MIIFKELLNANRLLIAPVLVITIVGTLYIVNVTDIQFKESSSIFLSKRLLAVFLGLAALCLAFAFSSVYKYIDIITILAALSLVLLYIPNIGVSLNHARRWLRIGGFLVQPSEFARIVLVVFISHRLAKIKDKSFSIGSVFWEILATAIFFLLIAMEPDLGSAMVLAATVLSVVFIAGLRIKTFLALFLVISLMVGVFLLTAEWRRQRILALFDRTYDKWGKGYQPLKSELGVATGGWLGKGFGNSLNKRFFLSEGHTDYIFSIYAEETGFVGSLALILLFGVVLGEAFHIAFQAGKLFLKYTAFGLGMLLFFQVAIHVGVAMNILPAKGLPLPLFSFGGSSYIAVMFCLGMLLRIHYDIVTQQ